MAPAPSGRRGTVRTAPSWTASERLESPCLTSRLKLRCASRHRATVHWWRWGRTRAQCSSGESRQGATAAARSSCGRCTTRFSPGEPDFGASQKKRFLNRNKKANQKQGVGGIPIPEHRDVCAFRGRKPIPPNFWGPGFSHTPTQCAQPLAKRGTAMNSVCMSPII